MEEEAERRAPLPVPRPVLGVSPAARRSEAEQAVAPRQGPQAGIQGEAGVRHLPCSRSSRRPQAPGAQGASVRRAACARHADPNRAAAQGIVYGKPSSQGITQLKPQRNLRSVAEERVGRKVGGLRVLNSYWVNEVSHAWSGASIRGAMLEGGGPSIIDGAQDSTYKYYEVIMVDPAHSAIRNVRERRLLPPRACFKCCYAPSSNS